jgi:hypothetical protein
MGTSSRIIRFYLRLDIVSNAEVAKYIETTEDNLLPKVSWVILPPEFGFVRGIVYHDTCEVAKEIWGEGFRGK